MYLARLVQHRFHCKYGTALDLVRRALEDGIISQIGTPEERRVALGVLEDHYEYEVV